MKEWWVVGGIILFCLLIVFYWFQLRPYYAKKSCYKEGKEAAEDHYSDGFYKNVYDECLLKKGIE